MQLLILLSLFSIVLSRPTFSTKPVDGVLNYAKGKLLKDNIVTLDDKETITMISCKPDSMNFTLTKKETKLKVGALVTGGPEWNCTKKEPFYRKIIKIANSTSNGIEVNTEDVPQKDFFRIAYGYEVCSKNMQNATSILKNITKLKKTVEDNLAKAEALTSEINKNGNQSVGKKILKDIKRTRAEMKKTFSEANQRVKAMEKISKEKKKVVLGTVKCDLGSLRKLLTKTQKHEKIASETLKKAQDAHKTVRSSYADVLTKVNSTLSAVFSFIDSANKNPSSLTPAQKTELSAIISKRDSILKNANAARTEKDSKKADAAIKEAKELDSRANLLKVTLSKLISALKKTVNNTRTNTTETATGAAAQTGVAAGAAAVAAAAAAVAAKTGASATGASSSAAAKTGAATQTAAAQTGAATQTGAAQTGAAAAAAGAATATAAKTAAITGAAAAAAQTGAATAGAAAQTGAAAAAAAAAAKTSAAATSAAKTGAAAAGAASQTAATTGTNTGSSESKCNKNPTIEKKPEAYMVSYYDKPVANMKNEILILDKVDEVAYVCCSKDEIELFFKPGKAILKRLDKVTHITGGKGWGCNNEIIQYQVSRHNEDQVSYSFYIKSKVDSSVFTRELNTLEICNELVTKVKAEQKTLDDLYKKADASFKEIKNSYNHMKSIGDDATKKDGQKKFEESEKVMNEVKKIHSYGSYDCMNGPFPTEKILTSLKEKNTQLTTLLDQLKNYASTTASMSTGIPVTAANVKKLVTELEKTTDAFFADIKLVFDLNNLSAENKKAFNDEKSQIKKRLDSLVNEAKNCKDDTVAKRIYSDVEKDVKAYKDLIANINKDIGSTKQEKKEKREMKSSTGDVFDEIKSMLSKAYNEGSLFIGFDQKDPELEKLLGDMEKVQADAKKKWDELKKFVDDTSETSKKRIEELDTEIKNLRENMKGFKDSFDAVIKKYQDFLKDRSAVEKIISDATKKKNEIAKKDKELAAKLTPQIAEASKGVNSANEELGKKKLAEATKLLADAKTKAEAALNSAGSTTVSTANYSEADTSKDNVKQRVKLITDESNEIVKKVQVNIDLIKKYDKDVSNPLEKEFKSLKNNINDCNNDAKSWFKTEESSKKAFSCSQEAQEAIKKFSVNVEEKLKTSTAKFSLPITGKVLSIPSNKVKNLSCKGPTVTIEFKEAVFVDPSFDQIEVDETVACVDENTNKRLAMKRKVTKLTENKEKKLVVETEFANSQSNEIVSNGASFSGNPVFSDSKVSASLTVENTKYLGKKAVVELVASGSPLTSTQKSLSKTTSITLTVDKSITCNSAILAVSVDGVRIASSESFSINPTIAFLKPDVAGRTYYNEEKIEVKMEYKVDQTKKGVNTLKLISAETKLAVYSKTLNKEKGVDVPVKSLPEDAKAGNYYFELTINGVTVKSQTISIVHDKFAQQQIVFTSPKTGQSFDPGQTIPIKWEVKNSRKSGKLRLGLAVQNSVLSKILGTPYVGADIPIEKGSYDYVVPKLILGDSRYYVYAEYDCAFLGGFCAKDQSDLFAIKSDICFNFTDIHVETKTPGEYEIKVSIENTGNCQFTKDDKIVVKMVTADQLKDRQVGFEFSGDQKSVTEPLKLTKGDAASLRFKITHKHNEKKGEFSWDFSAPFESDFNFDIGNFKPDWSCGQCGKQKPWKITPEAERKAGEALVEMNEKYNFFCDTLCNAFKFKLDRLFKTVKNDTETLIIDKVCKDKGSADDIANCTDSGKGIFKKIASYNPSFSIECQKCIIEGWVKVYDLDSRGILIRAGTIELKINYNFELVLTLGISKTVEGSIMKGPGEEQRDKEGKLLYVGYNQNKLVEGSIASAFVGDLLDLEALDIPILGAKAGLGGVRVPDKPDTFNLTAACMFYVKIQVKLTGHVKALVTLTGEINYIGTLQSGKKFTKKDDETKINKPGFKWLELEVELTITLSVGGTANFNVGKIIGADLTLELLRIVVGAKFRIPAYPALNNDEATQGLIDSNQMCKKPHFCEIYGDLYLFSLKLSLTVLGNTEVFNIVKETKIPGFKLCILPAQ